jgi:DNA polymerase-3 subunit epsilon
LSVFKLDILFANAQETAAHEDVLNQIDQASKGKTVWRASHDARSERVIHV